MPAVCNQSPGKPKANLCDGEKSASVFDNSEIALNVTGFSEPVRGAGPVLVGLQSILIGKGFVEPPDQGIISWLDIKGKAAGFCTRKGYVIGQVGADKGGVIGSGANQAPGNADYSHSIVPGGLEVMS
jgi:hypothetical protein